jgi:hypothetical protein
VRYPAGRSIQVAFASSPIEVHDGTVLIEAALAPPPPPAARVVRLRLSLQACDDRSCRLPVDLELEVPTAQAARP